MEIIDINKERENNPQPDEIETKLNSEDYTSSEFLFTCFSILESRGYLGFNELMSVIDNDKIIIKFLRLLGGMTIKVPSIKEFRICLLASAFAYYDIVKRNDPMIGAKGKSEGAKKLNYRTYIPSFSDIEKQLNLSEEDKVEIDKIYNDWLLYMQKEGYPIDNLYKISRNDTKRRFKKINPSINRKKRK